MSDSDGLRDQLKHEWEPLITTEDESNVYTDGNFKYQANMPQKILNKLLGLLCDLVAGSLTPRPGGRFAPRVSLETPPPQCNLKPALVREAWPWTCSTVHFLSCSFLQGLSLT